MSNAFEKIMGGEMKEMSLEELDKFFAAFPLMEIVRKYYSADCYAETLRAIERKRKEETPGS